MKSSNQGTHLPGRKRAVASVYGMVEINSLPPRYFLHLPGTPFIHHRKKDGWIGLLKV